MKSVGEMSMEEAAYFHWDDMQSLHQALWVAQENTYDVEALMQWSEKENAAEKFAIFLEMLNA